MGRTFTLIIIAVLVPLALCGQNVLFMPFGQDITELRQSLGQKDYIKRINTNEDLVETKVNYMRIMRYHLFYKQLYAVEDERVYLNKKEAERIIQTCIAYMEFDNRKAHVINRKNGVTHYATIHEDRIIELTVKKTRIKRKKYEYVLKLKTTSRFHGPRNKTEAFAQQIIQKFD